MRERGVDSAFRKAGGVGNCARIGADLVPFVSCGLAVQVQVNHKRRRLLIVPDQIAHQHIENVIVDGHGAFKTRHSGRMT